MSARSGCWVVNHVRLFDRYSSNKRSTAEYWRRKDGSSASRVNRSGLTSASSLTSSVDSQKEQKGATGQEIKLVSLMSTVSGEEVETRWGLHPRFRNDLTPSELQQLTKLLNRVAKILGERYASVAFSEEWASWHKAGHA